MANYAIVIAATVALVGSIMGTNADGMPSQLNKRTPEQSGSNNAAHAKRCGGCGGFGGWGGLGGWGSGLGWGNGCGCGGIGCGICRGFGFW
ncbi:hypothetical protein H4R24_003972 [Coemansia sp. RSA 988]|nr:hypothetical protein H4R24_003972 [Coemansia sp. RSA 988]